MTANKDLKRRIRERQQRTGENYVVARRAVLAEADRDVAKASPATSDRASGGDAGITLGASNETDSRPAGTWSSTMFAVVELDDITTMATETGFQCTISMASELSAQIPPREALQRLKDVLLATIGDPAMDAFRAVVLQGARPASPLPSDGWEEKMQLFVTRIRAGIGGVSDGGTILAVPVAGKRGIVMMVCQLGFGIVRRSNPAITLTTAEGASFYIERIAQRAMR